MVNKLNTDCFLCTENNFPPSVANIWVIAPVTGFDAVYGSCEHLKMTLKETDKIPGSKQLMEDNVKQRSVNYENRNMSGFTQQGAIYTGLGEIQQQLQFC